jgi:hypothetical protein
MSIVKVEKNNYTAEPLYQWDLNQTLLVYGLSLPSVPEIHFTNAAMSRAIVRQASMDASGVVSVEIPNSMLQKPYTVVAYICLYAGATFETQYKLEIPVKARTQPADYTLTDDPEVYSFNALENQVVNALHRMDAMTESAQAAVAEAKAIYSQAMAEMQNTTEHLEEQFGTFVGYSQDQILSTETKGLFGFDAEAVPNDVFAFLARLNLHCWQKEAAEKQYVMRVAESSTKKPLVTKQPSDTSQETVYYGDTIEMDATGVLTIPGETMGKVCYSGYSKGYSDPDLGGKYFTVDHVVYYYVEEGTDYIKNRKKEDGEYDYFVDIPARVVYAEEVEAGAAEYVFSTDRNAYPDNDAVDAFHYTYMGVPLDNALHITRCKTGSYTGTGTKGIDNSNSLTFDFTPKLVIVLMAGKNSFTQNANGFIYVGQTGKPASGTYLEFSVTDKTLTWYAASASSNITPDADDQFNTSGTVYYYIAMG